MSNKPIFWDILNETRDNFRVVKANGGWIVQEYSLDYVQYPLSLFGINLFGLFGYKLYVRKYKWLPYEDYSEENKVDDGDETYNWILFFETDDEAELYCERVIRREAENKFKKREFEWKQQLV